VIGPVHDAVKMTKPPSSRGWPGKGVHAHPREFTVLIAQAATLTTRSGLAERTNVF
jgi:hypothetical protein